MIRASLSFLSKLPRLRKLAHGLWLAGLPLLGGCAQLTATLGESELVQVAAADPQSAAVIVRAAAAEPVELLKPPVSASAEQGQVVPINLDTVLRLTYEQNTQIAIERERLRGAYAEKALASRAWLPKPCFGPTYLRWVNAQRKVWQQKLELSRVTHETLQDAANTYIDLLTARTSEAILRDMEKHHLELLDRAKKLAPRESAAAPAVETIQSVIDGHHQTLAKLHQQGDAASAKLAQLLGLPSCTALQLTDSRLTPFDLLDASVPLCDLVNQAWQTGPGIREMEGLLALAHRSAAHAQSHGRMLSGLSVLARGPFAADACEHDTCSDLKPCGRLSLSEARTGDQKDQLIDSKVRQAELAHQELRSKLALGVQEAREAILSGREQIRLAQAQIEHAAKAYELSNTRLKKLSEQGGGSIGDVLLTIRGTELAHFNSLSVISAANKAQVRLLLLLGTATDCQMRPQAGQ